MEYMLIEAGSAEQLEKMVSTAMAIYGWRCQGGVAMVRFEQIDRKGYSEAYWWYSQALVREKAPEGQVEK